MYVNVLVKWIISLFYSFFCVHMRAASLAVTCNTRVTDCGFGQYRTRYTLSWLRRSGMYRMVLPSPQPITHKYIVYSYTYLGWQQAHILHIHVLDYGTINVQSNFNVVTAKSNNVWKFAHCNDNKRTDQYEDNQRRCTSTCRSILRMTLAKYENLNNLLTTFFWTHAHTHTFERGLYDVPLHLEPLKYTVPATFLKCEAAPRGFEPGLRRIVKKRPKWRHEVSKLPLPEWRKLAPGVFLIL